MEVVRGLHWVDSIWDTKVYLLLEQDGPVVIDAATPGRAKNVWRHLALLGYQPEQVNGIWLTHGDIDHMGSIAALKARSGAQVATHRADAPLVDGTADRQLGRQPLSGVYQRLFNMVVHRLFRYQPAEVDRLVDEGHMLGEWQVVHTPGHTAGSMSFYQAERKIIIVGDALNHRRGRLGAPPPMFTPDMALAHASIRKIAELDFDVCCFGHGPPLMENAAQRVRAFAESLSR